MSSSKRGSGTKEVDKEKTQQTVGTDEKCPDCGEVCEPNSDSICCDICDSWYHAVACQGLKRSLYIALCDDENEDLHWFCKGCKRAAGKVMKTVSALSQRQDKMEANLESVASRVQKLEHGDLPGPMEDKIEGKVQDLLRAKMEEITREMRKSEQVNGRPEGS